MHRHKEGDLSALTGNNPDNGKSLFFAAKYDEDDAEDGCCRPAPALLLRLHLDRY